MSKNIHTGYSNSGKAIGRPKKAGRKYAGDKVIVEVRAFVEKFESSKILINGLCCRKRGNSAAV